MRLAEALYRFTLLAFPRQFRVRHGDGMVAQFRTQQDALRSRPLALGSFWVRAAVDSIWHGLAARREQRARSASWPSVREGVLAIAQDVRHAARGLIRDRGVTAVVVLALTVGIAANAVMFGVVDQLLLSPPRGVHHPEKVRRVYFGSESARASDAAVEHYSYPKVAAIRDGVAAFAAAAVLYREADVTIGSGLDARSATLELANAEFFSVLELQPSAGRFYTPAEDGVPDAAPVAVISHGFWTREFGADPAVVGRTLLVEGKPLTVVGIGPRGFSGVGARPVDVWAPPGALARALIGAGWESNFFRFGFKLVARLTRDSSDAVAAAQATAAARRTTPPPGSPGLDPLATAFTSPLQGLRSPNGLIDEGKVGLWLFGVAAVVLLVAMANVANLLITRMLSRRGEIAVRLALGVSRARLLRQLLADSGILAMAAGGLALALSYLGGRFVQQVLLPEFAWHTTLVDWRVLGITLVLAVTAALIAGLAPALHALPVDLVSALRAAGRTTGGTTGRLRGGLLVAQVAFSVVLLVGAGLFVKSLYAVSAVDVGMDLDRLILARLPDRPGVSLQATEATYARVAERVGTIPGVARVTVTRNSAPMGIASAISMRREGETLSDLNGRTAPFLSIVRPEYFALLGASLNRGRPLTEADGLEGARVAVINQALESERWPDTDALGQCLHLGGDPACTRIVGIVENILQYDRVANDSAQIYLLPSHPRAVDSTPRGLLIRSAGSAADLLPMLREALQSLAPDMPFVPMDTMEALTASQLQPWRLGTTMFLAFGGAALLIATIGLYSTMAHWVAQRGHEIGIRVALGASRRHVIATIGAHGAAMVAAGLLAGLLLAALATNWMADVLFDTSPRDPWVFATAARVIATAGVAAAMVPARRSTAVDPLVVLKAE